MNKSTLWFLVAQWGPQGYLFKIANKSDKTLQIFLFHHHIIKIKRAIYDEGKKGLKYERIMVSLISAIWLPRTILIIPNTKSGLQYCIYIEAYITQLTLLTTYCLTMDNALYCNERCCARDHKLYTVQSISTFEMWNVCTLYLWFENPPRVRSYPDRE